MDDFWVLLGVGLCIFFAGIGSCSIMKGYSKSMNKDTVPMVQQIDPNTVKDAE